MMYDFSSCFNVSFMNSFKYYNFIFTSALFSGRRGVTLVCVSEDFK